MIADGVLPENYNYNDVPLLTGEKKKTLNVSILTSRQLYQLYSCNEERKHDEYPRVEQSRGTTGAGL